MLHWKKSHKGNWESPYLFFRYLHTSLVTLEEIPQRELRADVFWCFWWEYPFVSYIGRNPTKGIESWRLLWWSPAYRSLRLHWKKSHKGNWEPIGAVHPFQGSPLDRCYIGRNPTKGIESWTNSQRILLLFSISYIGRNPTKGIESFYTQLFPYNRPLSNLLHWKKSHKGNWEAVLDVCAPRVKK